MQSHIDLININYCKQYKLEGEDLDNYQFANDKENYMIYMICKREGCLPSQVEVKQLDNVVKYIVTYLQQRKWEVRDQLQDKEEPKALNVFAKQSEMMRQAIEASEKVFPYTNIQSEKSFETPNWVKFLCY